MTAAPLDQVLVGDGSGVNSHLTPNSPIRPASTSRKGSHRRRRMDVENDAYLVFVARVIIAAGKRVATGDVEALPDLAQLYADLDQALITARSRVARVRLLLGTDRVPARGHPAGRPATLGRQAMTRHLFPSDRDRTAGALTAEEV